MEEHLKKPFADRQRLSQKLMMDDNQRVPFVVEKHNKSKMKNTSSWLKFLVPKTSKVQHFLQMLSQRIDLQKDSSIYLFIQDTLLKQDMIIGEVYEKYKEQDGFVYAYYNDIPSFGNK